MTDSYIETGNITLQMESSLFQSEDNINISTLKFHNIILTVGCKQTSILKGISGQFKSGRLSLILGPSGAGKTSLMNVLSGFKQNTTGQIYYNDEECKNKSNRKIASYITQNFAMFENLSTKETIKFAANMKLNDKNKTNKANVISNILKLLNLEKCSSCQVSKLSGGEQKRLSIAVELITNPPLMFFDEPTSGLDIVSSTQILNYLKDLALGGRIVVCVVHQPSSRLMKLFNDVLVIADGNKLYNGPVDDMVEYFESRDFCYPDSYNPADFEIASGAFGQSKLLQIINDEIKKSSDLWTKEEKFPNIIRSEESPMVLKQNGIIRNNYTIDTNHTKYSKKVFQQIYLLMQRSLRAQMRDMICVQLRIIVHLIVAVLIGVVFWDIGNEASKILSNSSCMFFFAMFLFFSNSMPSVLSCPLETSVFLREHLNGWYSIESYFVSKLMSDIPLQLICPTLFLSVSYYFTGQPMELERFAKVWLISVLTTVLGHSFGLMAGSTFNLKLAIFLVPASCIPMLIFSGFFIRTHELSVYLRPITHVSYFRYSLEGFIQAIYGNNRTELKCSVPFCYYKTAKKFLQDMDMDGDLYLNDIVALVSWIFFFYLVLYISLVIKVKKAQS